MHTRSRKLERKALVASGVTGLSAKKAMAGKDAGLKTWYMLLQNSRCVMVQGRWWWPWKAAIWRPNAGVLPLP